MTGAASAARGALGGPIFVVLGMHRGGTSTVARGLAALGVSLGDNLWGPKPENERGFWEDRDLYALNEELLAEMGEAWDSVRLFDALEPSPVCTGEWIARGRRLLAQKLAGSSPFGFKDPRTGRLLCYWRQVFDALAVEPRYVIAARNPVSVAHSLHKRNGLSEERSYLLWTEHMLAALQGTEHCRRVIVDYDLLLQEPARELRRIRQALAMPAPRDMENLLADYTAHFLSAELRHTRFDADSVRQATGIPGCVVRLHALLTELAEDRISPDAAECRDEVRRLSDGMRELSPALALAEREFREAAALAARVADLHAALELEREQAQAARKASSLDALLRAGDHQFVESAYLTLLLRRPDPGGLEHYLGRLRAGVPKIRILSDIIGSPEAASKAVELPGLREAVERYRRSRWPLIGRLLNGRSPLRSG